jgi:GTP diphosphokinase / guanosine-3',5'-bis(diphosphate) 3'-diphosphatase
VINELKEILLKKATYLKNKEINQLENAIEFSIEAHEGQKRKSGEPYVTHPLTVCEILVDNKADIVTLISGLLHDVVEDTEITSQQICNNFGEEVAFIVDGLTCYK